LKVDLDTYYEHVLSQPAPRILVAQDLDNPPIGALFGEVNASAHKALGCVGHVTNGGVRDLDECQRMGFHFFSGCIQVSHAYAHLESSGNSVEIGETTINPGDLIHGDKHGICIVPGNIVDELEEACRAMEALEHPLIILSSSSGFSPRKYAAARAEMIQQSEVVSKRFLRT
jgi:regulator of RNase E activity RraA